MSHQVKLFSFGTMIGVPERLYIYTVVTASANVIRARHPLNVIPSRLRAARDL